MTRRLILFIGPYGAALLIPRNSRTPPTILSCSRDDQDGNATLDAALALHAKQPLTLLFETPDILFATTAIPRQLSFWDRQKLIARRLDTAFPDAPYKHVIAQTETMAVFAALTANETLDQWTQRLRTIRPTPFSVALLPVEVHHLIHSDPRTPQSGWSLAMLTTRHGGLRLIAHQNGFPIYARLVPLDGSPHEQETSLCEEIEQTLLFLPRFGLQPSDPLSFLGLLPSSLHRAVKECADAHGASCSLVSPQTHAQNARLTFRPCEDNAPPEALLLLSFANRRAPFRCDLLTAQETKARQDHRLRRSAFLIGTACLLAAMFYTGVKARELMLLHQANTTCQNQITTLEKTFSARRAALEKETASLDRLRQAAMRRALFTKAEPALIAALPKLHAMLPPSIRVTSLTQQGAALALTVKEDGALDYLTLQHKLSEALPNLTITLAPAAPKEGGKDDAP